MRPPRRLRHPVGHNMGEHYEDDEKEDKQGPCGLGAESKTESRVGFNRSFAPLQSGRKPFKEPGFLRGC